MLLDNERRLMHSTESSTFKHQHAIDRATITCRATISVAVMQHCRVSMLCIYPSSPLPLSPLQGNKLVNVPKPQTTAFVPNHMHTEPSYELSLVISCHPPLQYSLRIPQRASCTTSHSCCLLAQESPKVLLLATHPRGNGYIRSSSLLQHLDMASQASSFLQRGGCGRQVTKPRSCLSDRGGRPAPPQSWFLIVMLAVFLLLLFPNFVSFQSLFLLSSFYICTHNNSLSWKSVTHTSTAANSRFRRSS